MGLEGEIVRLRAESPADLPLLVSLRNDMATQGWNQALPPDYTEAMERSRYDGRGYSLDRRDGRFVIERRDTDEAVGLIRYSDLQPRWSAVLGISVIQSAWGSRAAFDAQEVLLRFLFLDLGIRVARIWTHGANLRALRLAERSGFRATVAGRGHGYKGNQLFDIVHMDLLREEWFSLHPELSDELPPLWENG